MYKAIIYYSPDLDPDQLQKEVKTTTKIITAGKNKIAQEVPVSKISLAYPIKKREFAYSWTATIEGTPQTMTKLRESFAHNNNVIRYLITKEIVKKESAASLKRKARLKSKPLAPKDEVATKAVKKAVIEETPKKTEAKESTPKVEKKKKVNIEEIDKKLDELLDGKL